MSKFLDEGICNRNSLFLQLNRMNITDLRSSCNSKNILLQSKQNMLTTSDHFMLIDKLDQIYKPMESILQRKIKEIINYLIMIEDYGHSQISISQIIKRLDHLSICKPEKQYEQINELLQILLILVSQMSNLAFLNSQRLQQKSRSLPIEHQSIIHIDLRDLVDKYQRQKQQMSRAHQQEKKKYKQIAESSGKVIDALNQQLQDEAEAKKMIEMELLEQLESANTLIDQQQLEILQQQAAIANLQQKNQHYITQFQKIADLQTKRQFYLKDIGMQTAENSPNETIQDDQLIRMLFCQAVSLENEIYEPKTHKIKRYSNPQC